MEQAGSCSQRVHDRAALVSARATTGGSSVGGAMVTLWQNIRCRRALQFWFFVTSVTDYHTSGNYHKAPNGHKVPNRKKQWWLAFMTVRPLGQR
jgi:hypothetical protein